MAALPADTGGWQALIKGTVASTRSLFARRDSDYMEVTQQAQSLKSTLDK